MPNALSSPTMLGLYINSFNKNTGIPNDPNDISPFKNLLGTDGLGNYSGGNKLTTLFNYTTQYNYNYALFYGLSDTDFTSTVISPTFNAQGNTILNTVMPLAHSAGLVNRAAVSDVAQPQMSAAIQGATIYYGKYDGLSQIQKIINYNQSVSYDVSKIFNWINLETEFWNFSYNASILKIASDGYDVVDPTPYDVHRPRTRVVVSTVIAATGDFNGISRNDFIVINNEWRQVVGRNATELFVDRPFSAISYGQDLSYVKFEGNVDYETFLYRFTKAVQYINEFGTGEKTDIYVGFPTYTFKNTASPQPLQLAKLYLAGANKILLTNYTRKPNFDYVNANYAQAPVAGYHRISNDIVSAGGTRELGQIMSLESATKNNNTACSGGIFTTNNFVAYFAEGRSITPHSNGTDFKAVNSANIPIVCDCCATPMFAPPVTYNSLQMDELWQYVAATPPSGAGYPSPGSFTFNDYITAGGQMGTDLNTHIDFNTLVVFDQELMRQLVITPALALNIGISGTDETCSGANDGTASVLVTGGTAPYTYLWDDAGSSTTSSITGLPPGSYSCLVTDFLGVTGTVAITLYASTPLSFSYDTFNANCANENGSINFSNVQGPGNYLYSIVPTGNSPIWQSSPSFSGLSSQDYDLSLASGNPANGCITTSTVYLDLNSAPVLSQSHTNVTGCTGASNGSITGTIDSDAGTGPYSYSLYNASNILVSTGTSALSNYVFTGLSAGTYTMKVSNQAGCISNIVSITINQPTAVNVSATFISPPCYLGTDGSITATAVNGTSPYTYILTSNTGVIRTNSNGIFTNLAPGTYTYEAQDNNGCSTNIKTIVLSNPTPITAVYTVKQISQGLTNDGSITLEDISGGSPTYVYLWSTGETTSSISNLSTGTYTVYITDQNDCTTQYTFKIRVQCTELSYDEYKVQIYKAQCCLGNLAKKYIKFQKQGREDLACPVMENIKKLTLIIDAVKCDDNPGNEYCFSCDEMIQLLENIKNICACDCCSDENTEQVQVTFNSNTNQLDII